MSRQLEETIRQLRDKVAEQDAFIKKVTEPPFRVATIVRVDKEKRVWLATDSGTIVLPAGAVTNPKPGNSVLLGETGIVGTVTDMLPGPLCIIKDVIGPGYVEIETPSGGSVATCDPALKIEKGDRVIMSVAGSVVLHNLGKIATDHVVETPKVVWADIGGLGAAKAQMIDAIETPIKNAALYKHYGRKPPKGILLYGPPGCGKTLLGKAAATAIGHLHGSKHAGGFLYVKGPEILDMYVGESERKVRALFARARAFKKASGAPAIIFIDEADAILARRGTGLSSDVDRTIVPQFLSEMDGLEDSAAIVLLATNRQDTLDPAILRDGRIDHRIQITRPDQATSAEIVALNLKSRPLAKGESVEALSQAAAMAVFDPKAPSIGQGLSLHHVVNGAMLANVAAIAAEEAMRRDLKAGTITGIKLEEVVAAVERIRHANRNLDHSDAVLEQRVAQSGRRNGQGAPAGAAA